MADKASSRGLLLPGHVAIIMDGNGRWAQTRALPRNAGHVKGADTTRAVVEAAASIGLGHLSLFAFSSENWQRPREEVNKLMELFLTRLASEAETLMEHGIRLKIIGDREPFSAPLRAQMAATEQATIGNQGLCLNIAVNYGGRWDIWQAVKAVVRAASKGEIGIDQITPEYFAAYLSTAGQPDPDLLIRTGGESRISNYLLWQLSYAELYFTDTLWPEFGAEQLREALEWYAGRQRRYGGISATED